MKVISESHFNKSIESGYVLVEFTAPWCCACDVIKEHLNILEQNVQEDTPLKFLDVDVDEFPILEYKYVLENYPTLVLLYNGEEVNRSEGSMTKEEIANFVVEAIKMDSSLIYTVGAQELYDDVVRSGISYKAKGGSVWKTKEEAEKYTNRIFVNGKNVPGRVYGVKARWNLDVKDGVLIRKAKLVWIED